VPIGAYRSYSRLSLWIDISSNSLVPHPPIPVLELLTSIIKRSGLGHPRAYNYSEYLPTHAGPSPCQTSLTRILLYLYSSPLILSPGGSRYIFHTQFYSVLVSKIMMSYHKNFKFFFCYDVILGLYKCLVSEGSIWILNDQSAIMDLVVGSKENCNLLPRATHIKLSRSYYYTSINNP